MSITFAVTRSARLDSSEHMPSAWLVVIKFGSWCVFPSRMMLRTGWLAIRISKAATMPPSDPRYEPLGDHGAERRAELHPDLVLPPCGEDVDDAVDRLSRSRSCAASRRPGGPVSARVRASWIDSRSRISPTSRTSGSSRRAERSARSNDGLSVPTSR